MSTGQVTARALTQAYLRRIDAVDRGDFPGCGNRLSCLDLYDGGEIFMTAIEALAEIGAETR